MPLLQFQHLSSRASPSFWSAVNSIKLDKQGLDDSQLSITGWLQEGRQVLDREASSSSGESSNAIIGVDGSVGVGAGAFGGEAERPPADSVQLIGIFKNFNTIEEFRDLETKKKLFNQVVDSITDSFSDDSPHLNPFLLVTFADLKKYVYHYWFAFPALVSKPGWEISEDGLRNADEEDIVEIRQLERSFQSKLGENKNGEASKPSTPLCFLVKGIRGQRSVAPISTATEFFTGIPDSERYLAFHDPSSLPSNPGWPLRNILYYLHHFHHISAVHVICLRSASTSHQGMVSVPTHSSAEVEDRPRATGWERSKAGKLESRVADLGPMMDPTRLADQAVDLNLKLMRWRILPSLQLEKIAATKCLLLGAGTLGCYVARALMGWGIRSITFVDSARVSYSNPVRQPLFDFEDCLNGGKPKAQTAAERLCKIFPGVNATAHEFTIPMPGHPIPSSSLASTKTDVTRLEELVKSHDAVFLLMDSRESRWLPTVIAASQGKIVINAALGFDSYLVMRHGAGPDESAKSGRRLGCYYCNDVVAPTDSLSDRTLDQMCTVTRPGIAPIASATAVELLVSLVQHPLGINAPAETASDDRVEGSGSPLGTVPHQLRGQLSSWRTMLIEGAAYDRCTGCSKMVVEAYRKEGIDMLLKAFNDSDFLEKLTGLDELHKESEAAMDNIDWEEGSERSF
ncbi:MAG: Autophagy protein 7 [Tremellales sp. Tagirdzhanova-0007]|nr:MAG: Autophagy protein 7 [Tremellales sp. Tagirdzhanova-0007]